MADTQQALTNIQAKVWLMYARQQSKCYSRLSMNVTREVCTYLFSVSLLPSVYTNTLHLHNLETKSSVSYALGHTFTNGTVFCLYSERHLLCAGGYSPNREVWSFDIDAGDLGTLQQMEFERAWPGVVNFQDAVFVFGGNTSPSLQSCEVMDVYTKQWKRLPDMHSPKVGFSPTIHRKEIYLICPMPTECPFEVFNTTTRDFRVLPSSHVSNLYGCVSFLAENSIKVLTFARELITLNLENSDKATEPIAIEDQNSAVSNTPVVICQQQVWWVNYINGSVLRFDTMTNSIRVFTFGSPLDK